MKIVDKTLTRVMYQIMSALGVGTRYDLNNESGVMQPAPDVIHETFRWHDSDGVFQIDTVVSVTVTATPVDC